MRNSLKRPGADGQEVFKGGIPRSASTVHSRYQAMDVQGQEIFGGMAAEAGAGQELHQWAMALPCSARALGLMVINTIHGRTDE